MEKGASENSEFIPTCHIKISKRNWKEVKYYPFEKSMKLVEEMGRNWLPILEIMDESEALGSEEGGRQHR